VRLELQALRTFQTFVVARQDLALFPLGRIINWCVDRHSGVILAGIHILEGGAYLVTKIRVWGWKGLNHDRRPHGRGRRAAKEGIVLRVLI
jgi:hypothetical protein